MRKNKYGTYGTFSRSFSRVLAAAFVAAVAAGTMPVYSAYAASPSFARTEEEWAKLRDNVIEYDELEGLIHEYNATVQNNQYTYRNSARTMGIPMRKWPRNIISWPRTITTICPGMMMLLPVCRT